MFHSRNNIFNQDQSTPESTRHPTISSFHPNNPPSQQQNSFFQTPTNPFQQQQQQQQQQHQPNLSFHSNSFHNDRSFDRRIISPENSSVFNSPQAFDPMFTQQEELPTDYVQLIDDDEDDDLNMLASCIKNEAYAVQKVPGILLGQVSDIKIQQGLIVREIIFALLGYEGHYIQFGKKYNIDSITNRIEGPDYKIAKNLDISLKVITKKLVKFGKFYTGLKNFIQVYNNENFGKIIQKFCFCVSEFLTTYHSVILRIENEFKNNLHFNLNMLDQIVHQEVADNISHLYHISIKIHSVTIERSKLTQQELQGNFEEIIMKNTDLEPNLYFEKYNCCKGGLVLQIVQERISFYKGDPIALNFLIKVLDIISYDYVVMLNKWLSEGIIEDPFDEFLIREKKVSSPFIEIFQNKSEYYWNELFLIKNDGLLDQFKNNELQMKILNTGKYLNIFKRCTGLNNFETLQENLQSINSLTSSDLELRINEYLHRANKMLLKVLFQGFDFPNVLKIYQTLFLFRDSYNIDNFITKTFSELKKNKFKISVTRIQKHYDDIFKPKFINKVGLKTSISEVLKQSQKFTITSESFYKISKELLEKNSDYAIADDNIRGLFYKVPVTDQLSPSRASTVMSHDNLIEEKDEPTITSTDLSISLPFPLNLVMNQQISYQYEIMFKLLIQLKFLNKYCDLNWQEINSSIIWCYKGFSPEIKKWILRCRALLSRIKTFINEIQSYIYYDVIEDNFKEIADLLKQAYLNLMSNDLGSDMSNSINKQNEIFNNTILGTISNNSIFDVKISQRQKEIKSPTQTTSSVITVDLLISKLSDYSSTLLNDSLITKSESLDQLNEIFEFIFQFNNYIIQFKKVLILLNHDLFDKFSEEYPNKFNKPMDEISINKRFDNLSTTFLNQYEIFGEYLGTFLDTIKYLGQTENKSLLELSDRLEFCFPE
ncbi:unnamed protein product [Candida verbasci]|uniref:Spindle pole body component n=1 Tax=Candida verbasci TaxID=1227364 RepID=A0A9W4TU12_9ASCO|nr:unnamed protein product [Candida verbasci]